ncbi:MAG: hypothetical protein K2H47_06155 [Muribaculaceae bacterium]|nr:hypothetical protein [Muribaculaceae bacterium]
MKKEIFTLEELHELETLEIRGGNTDGDVPPPQDKCSNYAFGCGGGVTQPGCTNWAAGCGGLITYNGSGCSMAQGGC